MCIYNPKAIDYTKGCDIYDSIEDKVYTETEALGLTPEVRSRLTNRPRKIGCWVLTIEECQEILEARKDEI